MARAPRSHDFADAAGASQLPRAVRGPATAVATPLPFVFSPEARSTRVSSAVEGSHTYSFEPSALTAVGSVSTPPVPGTRTSPRSELSAPRRRTVVACDPLEHASQNAPSGSGPARTTLPGQSLAVGTSFGSPSRPPSKDAVKTSFSKV